MDPLHSVAPLSVPPTPNLMGMMQSKYVPSQAFPAYCSLQSLSKLHLLFLSRLSSGYILCATQDIPLVLLWWWYCDAYCTCTWLSHLTISYPVSSTGQNRTEWARVERSDSGIEGVWQQSGGTTLASARALCLDLLLHVQLRISGGLNCCQEFQRGKV